MGANLSGFRADEQDEMMDFEPIPSGKYTAIIIDSEMKQTKKENGSYLELVFKVVDGPHNGRQLWARLNLDNPNPTAVKIAKSELGAICKATGNMTPNDSAEMHDIPMTITVKLAKRKDTGEMANEIKGYAKRGVAVESNPEAPQTPQADDKVAPWLQR